MERQRISKIVANKTLNFSTEEERTTCIKQIHEFIDENKEYNFYVETRNSYFHVESYKYEYESIEAFKERMFEQITSLEKKISAYQSDKVKLQGDIFNIGIEEEKKEEVTENFEFAVMDVPDELVGNNLMIDLDDL